VRLVVVSLVTAALAGCTTLWEREGSGEKEFYMDQGQCEAQAGMSPAPLQRAIVFEACLRGKGWRKVKS
jgi:hypothetical protein